MAENKPPLTEFTRQIEDIFSQPLTPAASIAADDFWQNWTDLVEGVSENSIRVNVDMLMLGIKFPDHGKYHIWKGLGIVVSLIGIILLLFIWQVGIIFLIIGFSSRLYGGYVRNKGGREFTDALIRDVRQKPSSNGMANLCAHYIAGTIALVSVYGRACWPQYPSCVISGKLNFIPTK